MVFKKSSFTAKTDAPRDSIASLSKATDDKFRQLEKSLTKYVWIHLHEHNVVIEKPRTGMVVFADGTNWNPGSGQGVYVYYGGAWHFLG